MANNNKDINTKGSAPLSADELFKKTREIREMIKKNNPKLLADFDETVGTALQKTIEKAIRDTYGEDYLKKIKEHSNFWSEFRRSPL